MGISCGIFENLRIDANKNKDDMKISDVRAQYLITRTTNTSEL